MKRSQQGFSLMELLVVVAILTLIMAMVFTAVSHVQRRSNVEAQRVDVTQGARELIDQISRDLRNSGYPRPKMYDPTAAVNANDVAAGLLAVSATELRFEGDIDGSGHVSSVGYRVTAAPDGKCPCIIERSARWKAGFWTDFYEQALGNVINSTGGGSAWAISGTTPKGVSNDVVYANFKTAPVFQYLTKYNGFVTVPTDLTGGNLATGQAATTNVASVLVTVNVLSPQPDQQTGMRSGTTLQTSIKLPNRTLP